MFLEVAWLLTIMNVVRCRKLFDRMLVDNEMFQSGYGFSVNLALEFPTVPLVKAGCKFTAATEELLLIGKLTLDLTTGIQIKVKVLIFQGLYFFFTLHKHFI